MVSAMRQEAAAAVAVPQDLNDAPALSASEAQSLLRLLMPKAEFERSYTSVMLLPTVDGTHLYTRSY